MLWPLLHADKLDDSLASIPEADPPLPPPPPELTEEESPEDKIGKESELPPVPGMSREN